MKPYSPRLAALRGLAALERGEVHRLRVGVEMRNLNTSDRALAWELAQGTERMHLCLDFVLTRFVDRHLPSEPLLLSALRLGAYQLMFLTRMPARAAVHETVDLLKHGRGFANAVLRRLSSQIVVRTADPEQTGRELALPGESETPRCLVFPDDVLPSPDTPAFSAVRHGLPEHVVERWWTTHGPQVCEEICAASSEPPGVVLRATDRIPAGRSLIDVLEVEGVTLAPLTHPRLFRLLRGPAFATDAFAEGFFVAQDPTATAAGEALGAQAGETVLDLCAAPGTKTTQLAEAVGESGRVLAYDIDPLRRARVRENVDRLGHRARVTILEDLEGVEDVDRVLVDVPCSNTGVLARRVEVRRRLRPGFSGLLAETQHSLLRQALDLCREGGTVVYSTCSLEPEENHQIVDQVLLTTPQRSGQILRDRLTLPRPDKGDGGYFAVLQLA